MLRILKMSFLKSASLVILAAAASQAQAPAQNGQEAAAILSRNCLQCHGANAAMAGLDLRGREALVPVFADLKKYDTTTHFIGQSTIFILSANRATGETYCLAHHVTLDGDKRRLIVASLRYLDTFVNMDGAWLFAERLLYVDWMEERALP